MARPKVELPPQGGAVLGEPKKVSIALRAPNGEPVQFECVAVQLLTDNGAQQLFNIVTAAVEAALIKHGLIPVPPTPIEEGTAVA